MLALNFSGKCYIMGNYIMGGEEGGLHTLVLHNGGLNVGVHTIFYFNFAENSLIFTTFCNSSIPGPTLRKLGSLFYYYLGVLHLPYTPVVM
jgi:hypothetical protein